MNTSENFLLGGVAPLVLITIYIVLFCLIVYLLVVIYSIRKKNGTLNSDNERLFLSIETLRSKYDTLLQEVHEEKEGVARLKIRLLVMERAVIELPLPPDLGAPHDQRSIYLPRVAQKKPNLFQVTLPGSPRHGFILHRDPEQQDKDGERELIYTAIRESPEVKAELGVFTI